ncbi:MAG: histidinol-phosphate transaminase [Deltaproteobacteria bacterium]|nr:histidinol-phosphate transaminase [Deltaproteobacteria bacterium]
MESMVNANILELMPYQPGKPLEEVQREFGLKKVVKLASNENPFPVPPHVAEAIEKEIPSLRLYPDTDSYFLRKRIAECLGVGMENVLMGSGSVELIKMIVRVFLRPGEKVLTAKSTFPMFKAAAVECGGRQAVIEVDMDEGYGYDLDRMYEGLASDVKILFIANPNNPTGTMLSKEKLLDFINSVPNDKIVVLDNAYQEYVLESETHVDGIDLALNRKNVIVLRTFSKIYGLAGLRIGYGIANGEAISYLSRLRAPFNVTRVGQQAALASLQNDDFKMRSAEVNNRNKEVLFNKLRDLGMNPVPSHANFILFFPGKDINEVNERLLREGVVIRPLKAFGVPDGMRVTVGFEEDNDFFIEKLRRVMENWEKPE